MILLRYFSHPGFFGKVGMRTFHLTVNRSWSPAVNVDHLWSLLPKNTLQEASKKKGVAPGMKFTSSLKLRSIYKVVIFLSQNIVIDVTKKVCFLLFFLKKKKG